ncbi:GHMP kinase N-terminal domain [Macleaya cordata]|uniref:GHMP kinase N-terminal domain n=1 Tax=Macleaya cordata TaxID=56857 RepID=A0A200QWY6_MACCD|nr:GHMP kinase N-terminal domain [Macleaya cordata]
MRIDEDDQVSVSPKHFVFAYYLTGHGFGHATRAVEVARHLISAGHDVHVVTGAPDFVFTSEIQSTRLFIRKVLLDCGAVQADALSVDPLASLEKYSQTAVVPRASILTTEVEWLTSIKADLVVSDVVPIACRAAADAGIRSVCVTNFSRDFIYAEYVMAAGYRHHSIVWQQYKDIFAWSYKDMPGLDTSIVEHHLPTYSEVRPVKQKLRRLRPEWMLKIKEEVTKQFNAGFLATVQYSDWLANIVPVPKKDGKVRMCIDYRNLNKASPKDNFPLPHIDILVDNAACHGLLSFMDGYSGYNQFKMAKEDISKTAFITPWGTYGYQVMPFGLKNAGATYQRAMTTLFHDMIHKEIEVYVDDIIAKSEKREDHIGVLTKLFSRLRKYQLRLNPNKCFSGASRLRDAIVLGYQLQRAPGRDADIPEWYSIAENELGIHTSLPSVEMNEKSSPEKLCIEEFEILHGDLHGLPDTVSFLRSLAELDIEHDSGKGTEKFNMQERIAAAGLFNWEVLFISSRAPGRLDVMGGIADYSGSLVLQMPIREACHVAVQRTHPGKQKLWKHAKARQLAKGQESTPLLQIVSYASELSNRGPTFDMDLTDFMNDEQPISYEEANRFFAKDPSQKWAAYVAGTVLVLMTELGVRFDDGMSILVSSAVPEGKGVSSSAAVEVATMSAIAAAYGCPSFPSLDHICVENHIVGAPCGVMDQMASACGEANKLLAMVCQPAEVIGLVNIPTHIRFWGIDSGIRHSIGGADYGSVRVGAFMGRKIIKSIASALSSSSSSSANPPEKMDGINSDEPEEDGTELLGAEASLDYLCNLSPHRYEAMYAKRLPDSILGEAFLESYLDHNDPVTTIDHNCSYVVKAPASHPIYENFRVKAFKALLSADSSNEQLLTLGELMYQCHNSYGACGLGSDGTDRLVKLVQEMQHSKLSKSENGTLFGAKITGGGSGGSVCIIGRNCLRSSEQILEIQQRYKAATGYLPFLFEGSSPGAGEFGYLKILPRFPQTQS